MEQSRLEGGAGLALLNDSVRTQLRPLLDELPAVVELALYPGPEADAAEVMTALMGEMVELSRNLRLKALAEAPPVEPGRDSAFGLEGPILTVAAAGAAEARVRFLGVTGGHEFGSLVAAVQHAASGQPELAAATVDALGGLGHRVHIQVFSTPT
jgi:alkyl hydroperoxide reductase subunit AhpF